MLLETLGKIGFDYKLAIANAVNFVVIFFLLKRYFFGPIGKAIETRRLKNEESIAFEERAKILLEEATKKEENILTEAHHKAKKIMDKAETKGKEILEHFQKEGVIEKERILNDGIEQIRIKEKEARNMIQEEASQLIVLSAEKLINVDLDDKTKALYIESISKEL